MIRVYAGTYCQFKDYLRFRGFQMQMFRYVSSIEQLYGLRNNTVILVGSYQRRTDYRAFNEISHYAQLNLIEDRLW